MPRNQPNKEEKSKQKALQGLEKAAEKVKQLWSTENLPELRPRLKQKLMAFSAIPRRTFFGLALFLLGLAITVSFFLFQTKSGGFVDLEDVEEGYLICFKTDNGDIKCGYALDCYTNRVIVVLKERKMRTALAGRKIWLAKGLGRTTKSINGIFEDEDFDHIAFKSWNLGEKIGQDKIESGTCAYFQNKKGTMFCGYAYRNGSNIRFVCEDRVRIDVSSERVWESDTIKTKKRIGDTFADTDFKYKEKKIIKEVRDQYDIEDITDRIEKLQARHGE